MKRFIVSLCLSCIVYLTQGQQIYPMSLTATSSTTANLNVNGNIRACEVKVNATGCDFVFEKNYNLMSLYELEKFINKNKHLPEIPTAKEVEENGVEVGVMQSKLLQKVEELTLYIIEQNKRIKKLEKENENLKTK